MKENIHPEYKEIKVICSCGSTFTTRSTLDRDSLTLEVCAKCHPFYTGTQKIVDTAGRVDRFRQKYGMKTKADKTESKAADTAAPPAAEEKPAEQKAAAPKAAAPKAAAPKAAAEKAPKKAAKKDDKKSK